jgi:hypothetical protein
MFLSFAIFDFAESVGFTYYVIPETECITSCGRLGLHVDAIAFYRKEERSRIWMLSSVIHGMTRQSMKLKLKVSRNITKVKKRCTLGIALLHFEHVAVPDREQRFEACTQEVITHPCHKSIILSPLWI